MRLLFAALLVSTAVGCGGGICDRYCAALDQQCSDKKQFASNSACHSFCESSGITPGTDKDTNVDSIGCRLHYAEHAAGDAMQCDIAGSSGGGVCGEWCDTYCVLAQSVCTADKELYTSMDECHDTCTQVIEHLPPSADGKPGGVGGMPNDGDGNTVQCRLFQLSLAASDPGYASLHCAAGALSSGICKAG